MEQLPRSSHRHCSSHACGTRSPAASTSTQQHRSGARIGDDYLDELLHRRRGFPRQSHIPEPSPLAILGERLQLHQLEAALREVQRGAQVLSLLQAEAGRTRRSAWSFATPMTSDARGKAQQDGEQQCQQPLPLS